MGRRSSIDDEIDEIVEKINEIEKHGWSRASANPVVDLDDLREKLAKLKDEVEELDRDRDRAEEQASAAESATEEVEENREALDALYRKALYVLGHYGIGERDLHFVYGHESPAELARKFGQQPVVQAVRSAIAEGRAAGHQSCAYVGACLDYDVGLADRPCSAGREATKGRHGVAVVGSELHAQCHGDRCFPHSLGWISEAERCR